MKVGKQVILTDGDDDIRDGARVGLLVGLRREPNELKLPSMEKFVALIANEVDAKATVYSKLQPTPGCQSF